MKKEHMAWLSALIFLTFGLISQKWHFLGFGLTFILIGLASYLKNKQK